MKKNRLTWMLATGLLSLLGFSSCSKPDPLPAPMYGPPPDVYTMYGPRPSSYQTLPQVSSPSEELPLAETPGIEALEE